MHWKRNLLAGLGLALILALLIRLPFYSQIPRGLNRDEAALGYNAYSLLRSGHDEFGQNWPISITSFGDQKLPGYIYALMPLIAVFNLTAFTTRLPSFLSGLIIIGGLGYWSFLATVGTQLKLKARLTLSWLVMILVAISPWGNHFSRVAYEAHLALALFITGLCAYTLATQTKNLRPQRYWLIGAAILWSLTLLTYHSYHVFIPLFLLGLGLSERKKLLELDRASVVVSLLIGLSTVGLLSVGGVWSANFQKNKGITPFNYQSLQLQSFVLRDALPGENAVYERLLINPVTEAVVRLSQNLVQVPAGSFLFVSGTGHGDHNPGNIPNLHLFTAPFIILGLLWLWDQRKYLFSRRLALWLAASFVPSALTISPQHTIRFSPAFPALELLAALGILFLYSHLKLTWQKRCFWGILGVIMAVSVLRMMTMYLSVVPKIASPNEKFHLLAKTIAQYEPTADQVITQSPSSSPYIWYLFESKYDPQKVNLIQRYPADVEGFVHVKQVDKLYVETIDWGDVFERGKDMNVILIFKPSEIPEEQRLDNRMHLINNVVDSQGVVQYEVWSI